CRCDDDLSTQFARLGDAGPDVVDLHVKSDVGGHLVGGFPDPAADAVTLGRNQPVLGATGRGLPAEQSAVEGPGAAGILGADLEVHDGIGHGVLLRPPGSARRAWSRPGPATRTENCAAGRGRCWKSSVAGTSRTAARPAASGVRCRPRAAPSRSGPTMIHGG